MANRWAGREEGSVRQADRSIQWLAVKRKQARKRSYEGRQRRAARGVGKPAGRQVEECNSRQTEANRQMAIV